MSGTPWHHYGLIVRIAQSLSKAPLGKTKLQKLVFLMQELKDLPSEYRFHFYTYGPYSSSLTGDASYLDAIGGLTICQYANINGYEISPGKEAEAFIAKAQPFFDEHGATIDAIIAQFGYKSAQELELIATLVYVMHYDRKYQAGDRGFLIAKVKELKPKFNQTEVKAALDELVGFGYLDAA
jgi:uncharacterized protein YwgA